MCNCTEASNHNNASLFTLGGLGQASLPPPTGDSVASAGTVILVLLHANYPPLDGSILKSINKVMCDYVVIISYI